MLTNPGNQSVFASPLTLPLFERTVWNLRKVFQVNMYSFSWVFFRFF